MSEYWFLIKNGRVVNKIVADPSFIKLIRADYDYIFNQDDVSPVNVDIMWFYDAETGIFSAPPPDDPPDDPPQG